MKTKMVRTINILNDFTLPTKSISKMSDSDLIAKRDELKAIIKEANEILESTIDPELFTRADKHEERKYGVENRTVQIIERPNFNFVPLKFAKKFKATKIVVDADVLKPLWKKGVRIPDVKVSEYITVR